MKRIVALTCAVLLSVGCCSNKLTNPTNNKPATHTPFRIAYTADASRVVSARITAANGGSITAQDRDGVQFQLTIPAHALRFDTTVTVTPLSSLRMGGPGKDRCLGCSGTDSLCCYRGALFEPAGLAFDSAAVLTVQMPTHMGFPYPHGGLIVYLDAAGDRYEPCYTTYDTTASWLKAKIIHFSAYGLDDERYDRMEETIYEHANKLAGDIGTPSFYWDLYPLNMDWMLCGGMGCGDPEAPLNMCWPDLVNQVEKLCLDAYTKQARIEETKAATDPPCDGLGRLYQCFMNIDSWFRQFGNYNGGFSTLDIELKSDYVVLVNKTANAGHALCQIDSCRAGQELLGCALGEIRNSIHSEIHFDTALIDSVWSWIASCCRLKVSLSADKSVLRDMVISDDNSTTVVTFTLEASDPVGPLVEENFTVDCRKGGSGTALFYLGGMTDDNGIGHCKYAWCYLNDCPNWLPEGIYEFRAHVQYDGKDVASDPAMITLNPIGVSMDYHYSFTDDYYGVAYQEIHSQADMAGRGVIFSGDVNTCRQQYSMTRTAAEQGNSPTGSCVLIDTFKLPACFFTPVTSVTYLADQTPICVLKGASVMYRAGIAFGRVACTSPTSPDTTYYDNWQPFGCCVFPSWYYSDDSHVLIPFDGGSFRSIMWDTVATDIDYGTRKAHLSIDMHVVQ